MAGETISDEDWIEDAYGSELLWGEDYPRPDDSVVLRVNSVLGETAKAMRFDLPLEGLSGSLSRWLPKSQIRQMAGDKVAIPYWLYLKLERKCELAEPLP